MNKTFKVIWNHAAQNWVAVSELNKAKGKTKSLSLAKKGLFKFSLISSALALMNDQAVAITGAENQLANSAVNYCYYKHEYPNGQVVCGGSSTSATGLGAIAIGNGSVANSTHGNGVVAIGINSKVDGAMSVGLGSGNIVNGSLSNAIGFQNTVDANYASVLGFWNKIVNQKPAKDVSGAFGQGNQIINSGRAYAFGYNNTIGSINNSADNSLALGSGSGVFSSSSTSISPSGSVIGARNSHSIGSSNTLGSTSEFSILLGEVVNVGASSASVKRSNDGNHSITYTNQTKADYTVAIGHRLNVSNGSNSIAMGRETNISNGSNSIAMGYRVTANRSNVIAMGNNASASGISSIAFGYFANASANSGIAIGHTTQAANQSAVAVGLTSRAQGWESLALGAHAQANHLKDVALGAYSSTEMAVGTTSATVNNITYGNFCGTSPVATVSVGSTNEKRTITNVAAGRISNVSTDAINGSQLYWVANNLADEIAKVKKMTWNATSAADSNGTVNNNSLAEVGNGDTVTFEAGKNITITQNGRKFTIEATGSGSTTNVTVDAGEGIQVNSTTNGNNVTYTVTAKTDGTTIKIDNNGNISAVTTDLNVVGGKVEEPTGSNASALVNATTVTKAINNSGFTLKTSATPEGQKEASSTGEELITPGKAVEMVAGKNLTVKQSANGTITYATKDDVNFNSVTVGNTTISHDGVRITGGPSITTNGIDAGNKKITNVAPGEISATSKDAVNGSQLYAVGNNINNLNNRVNKIDKDLRAGIAGAAAIAGLPQVRGNGKSMMAVAASNYRGENAVALGYTRASDNGKVLLKLSGSTNTRGDVVSAVGLGYEW